MAHRLGAGAEAMVFAKKFSKGYEKHRKVLAALASCRDSYVGEMEFLYLSFDQIADRSGVARVYIRRLVRYLARRGLAQYKQGLFSEDGCPRGAGYAATQLGRVVSDIVNGDKDGETTQDTHHQ